MSYSAFPTIAQAMSNKSGTAALARQPKAGAAAGSVFEALLRAAGRQEKERGSNEAGTALANAQGLWGTLLSKYIAIGLSAGDMERTGTSAQAGSSAEMTPEAPGAVILADFSARMGSGAAVPDVGTGAKEIRRTHIGPDTGHQEGQHSVSGGGKTNLGFLSAAFESGAAGIDAVGYDPGGGTSYGLYQIASRPGTMDRFIDFLDREAPAWGERLRAAGNTNTGGTGGEMPRVWKTIASEDPARFTILQHAFIEATHYRPAERKIAENEDVILAERSEALREVLWSTAVQHGPDGAVRMFQTALAELRAGGDELSDAAIIERVYLLRSDTAAGHDAELASALRNRFREEKRQSLQLLAGGESDGTTIG